MARRFLVSHVAAGEIFLDAAQAHHARDVLRLGLGDAVELFDAAGSVAAAKIVRLDPGGVVLRVERVAEAGATFCLTIVAAVPKGDRADWMVEKLSELGVTTFVPLAAERSVVLPTGSGKRDRWSRIAIESAKQSKRAGVMAIEPLSKLDVLFPVAGPAFVFSTAGDARLADEALRRIDTTLTLFIGPEGGWTDGELGRFAAAGILAVRLPTPVLRVETAAVAAAVLAACLVHRDR